MTFEERLAALGVETRDFVPSDEHCKRLYDKFYAEAKRICKTMSVELDGPFMISLLLVAVAKRDIIIDRLETRIVNLTGELNYIKDVSRDCATCTDRSVLRSDKCNACDESFSNYEFAGVPEDWSVDDES